MVKIIISILVIVLTGTGVAGKTMVTEHKVEAETIITENIETEVEVIEPVETEIPEITEEIETPVVEIPEVEVPEIEVPEVEEEEEEVIVEEKEIKYGWTKYETDLLDAVDGILVITVPEGTKLEILEHLQKSYIKVSYEETEYYVSVRHLAGEGRLDGHLEDEVVEVEIDETVEIENVEKATKVEKEKIEVKVDKIEKRNEKSADKSNSKEKSTTENNSKIKKSAGKHN